MKSDGIIQDGLPAWMRLERQSIFRAASMKVARLSPWLVHIAP